MNGYWLLLCHLVGDYVLQSDWMASTKTQRSSAALAHVSTYVLPFLFLTRAPLALAFIVGTHFVIDRWRLARYVVWLKNFLSPPRTADKAWWRSWSECSKTGYPPELPPWLTTWLMILVDNILHLACNAFAVIYLA